MSSTHPSEQLHLVQDSESLPQSATQKTYVKKLRTDIERTKRFVEQAQKAILQFREEETKLESAQKKTNPGSVFSSEDSKKAHLLALHEVYKQLPYLAIKNDLIGIATATTLTSKAVQEQARTSKALKSENESIKAEILALETVLSDYHEVDGYLKTEIKNHPSKIDIQKKIRLESKELEEKLEQKIDQIKSANASAKRQEDLLYSHVQRIVVKLHAMMDWETTSIADEETFRLNILRSATFIKKLVLTKALQTDSYVKYTSDTLEEHLAKLMLHHKILRSRNEDGNEVSL